VRTLRAPPEETRFLSGNKSERGGNALEAADGLSEEGGESCSRCIGETSFEILVEEERDSCRA